MIQIRMLKEWGTKKIGDIINISKKGANSAIEAGVAEYLDTKKEEKNWIKEEWEKHKASGKIPTQLQTPEFQIKQFEKFYHFLMKESPRGYIPWFFPCDKKGKNPSTSAILKINPLSKGSWHHESARLNKEQCIEHLREGYNIGISARTGDPLIIGDIDEAKYMNQMPKDTLTTTSRKRCGGHFFGWDKDGSAKINLPTDCGEIRSSNQYVISPGSYVPFHLENEKEKRAFDNLTKEAQKDKLLGYYTIKESVIPREISFNELPKFFIEKEMENIESEAEIKNRNEEKSFKQEGKYTELFNLKVSDIVGLIPANKRQGHPLHESDTDANFSLSKDGALGMCWRHLVSLNAVQYLCVKAGYKSCVDCGTPHKGRGISKIKGDKKSYEVAYQEALKLGLISEYKKEIINENLEGNLKEDVLTKIALKKPREATELIVESFEKDNYIYSTRDDENSEMWIYHEGIYIPEGKTFIKEFCREILGKVYTGHLANEVITKIETDTFIDKEKFFKNNYVYEIPINDGILNILTRKISPFTPEKVFFNKLNLNYKPKQKCEKIEEFFKEILTSPEDIKVMFEIFGFLLLKDYNLEKAIMFNGSGRNGKSKTLRLMEKFVGTVNCCNVGLSSMIKSNFDLEDLFGKLVNLAGDTGKTSLKDTGCFKELTGRDGINLPRKFKRTIRIVNYAKHIFACNDLPIVYDDSDGFWTKWILIDFPFKFITKEEIDKLSNEDKINKKIIDLDILQKISTQEELDGLLNSALDGLDRILKNKSFSSSPGTDELKKTWKRRANSFNAFCEDCVKEDYEGTTLKRKLKKVYFDYCKKYKLINKATDKQIKYFLESNFSVEEFRENTENGQIYCWKGIILKEQNSQGSKGFSVTKGILNSYRNSNTLSTLSNNNNLKGKQDTFDTSKNKENEETNQEQEVDFPND